MLLKFIIPASSSIGLISEQSTVAQKRLISADVDVDLRAQADASMPSSNNNVNYTVYS